MGKNMTEAALAANRKNAERSTGPRTPEGKAVSAMNRQLHGLTGRADMVTGEDPQAFARLREGLAVQLAPVGVLEEALMDRVAACLWRLWRTQRIEAGLLTFRLIDLEESRNRKEDVMKEFCKELCNGTTEASRAWAEQKLEDLPTWGQVFVMDCQAGAMDKLNRYETALERSLYRAMHELERLQRARLGEPMPPPAVADLTVHGGQPNGFES